MTTTDRLADECHGYDLEGNAIPGFLVCGINENDDTVDDTPARFRNDEAREMGDWIAEILAIPDVRKVEIVRETLSRSEAFA